MVGNKETNVSDIEDDLEEEPGEVIESAPPLKVGEERDIHTSSNLGLSITKKLLKLGHGFETPLFGDEVTVHYVATLLDGTKCISTRDQGDPFTFKLCDDVESVLDYGIITMKKGEVALFTLPSELGFRRTLDTANNIPPNSRIQFEVELLSWIVVVDICKDGGIIKKVLAKGKCVPPGDLDEVTVKYQVMLDDGAIVAETPAEGVEFYIKDGNFCPALPKALKTMQIGEKVKLIIQPQYAFGDRGLHTDNGSSIIPANSMLNIDLELVSFKPVIDVSGDMKVLKKILKNGEGSHTADEGAAVTLRYIARLEDGTIFEKKGFDGNEPLKFVIAEDQVIAGLDRAAATMKKGELSMVTVNPDYGYGVIEVKRDLATVPASSVIVYEVEMVDFLKEKSPWKMNNQEKIEAADKKKEEGNRLFKSGKYQQAAKRYVKAVDYFVEDGAYGDDEQRATKALRVSCWLNHAACSLKLSNFQEAIKLCSKVLDIEFHNIKALYRRAQAFIETGDLDLAELDIKKALEVDPHNREMVSLHKTLKQVQLERNKRDAKLYMNMFAPREVTSVVTKRLKVEKPEDEKSDEDAPPIEAEDAVAVTGQSRNELICEKDH